MTEKTLKQSLKLSKEESKTINELFSRCRCINCFGAQGLSQGNLFVTALAKEIDKMYRDDEDKRIDAYIRHTTYFNSHQVGAVFLVGMAYGLEKQVAIGSIPASTVNEAKFSLMGPLAGILDPLYMTVFRVIAAGIGMSLCADGSILGPILFFAIYGGLQISGKYFGIRLGYTLGDKALNQIFGTGIVESITKCASILGLMMIGCMTAANVSVKLGWIINISEGVAIDVQSVLDKIFPGLLPVILTLFFMKTVNKKYSITTLVFAIIIICVVLSAFGIFG